MSGRPGETLRVGDRVTMRGQIQEVAEDGAARVQFSAIGSDRYAMWFDATHLQLEPSQNRLPLAEAGAVEGKPRGGDDGRQGMAAEGAPVVRSTADKATGQVQAGAYDPGSASAPQPSTTQRESEPSWLRDPIPAYVLNELEKLAEAWVFRETPLPYEESGDDDIASCVKVLRAAWNMGVGFASARHTLVEQRRPEPPIDEGDLALVIAGAVPRHVIMLPAETRAVARRVLAALNEQRCAESPSGAKR